ncbi:transposase protein [mine drainage metagenome]|uniref:Transposase protein n=1 Tax=mine drainage metagenome TaxID=410659 RepID=T1BWJ2_9ZZZZ
MTFRGQRYIIQTHAGAPRYALHGRSITVCEHPDNTVTLLHGAEILPGRVFDPRRDGPEARIADDKSLNERVDQALTRTTRHAPWKPSPEHPWRRASWSTSKTATETEHN